MTQAKRCNCGQALRPGESHDCPVHKRHVSYSDDYSFVIVDTVTGIAILADNSGIGDTVVDFIGDLLN